MNITGKSRIQSKVDPSVWFHIRSLNLIQRSKRDAAILKERDEYRRALREKLSIIEAVAGPNESDKQPEDQRPAYYEARWQAFMSKRTLEQAGKYEAALERELSTFHADIMPAVIKAGLVSIEGLQCEGKQVLKIEDFLETPNDALLEEVYRLCEEASSLTDEAIKN